MAILTEKVWAVPWPAPSQSTVPPRSSSSADASKPYKKTASQGAPGIITPVTGDITSKDSLQAAYDTIASQTSHVDLLISNSGIVGPTTRVPNKPNGSKSDLAEVREKLWSLPMEDFTGVLHTNVTDNFYTVVAFLPLLEAANKRRPVPVPGVLSPPTAQVIVTSSIGGFARAPAVGFPYSLSKAIFTHLVKMMSTNFLSYEIRVNGIAPGL